MEELLDLSGFLVHTASNGKKAIELAKKELPDLVLCDIMMPEMDGYEVLEILSACKETCRIPFVFVSVRFWTFRYEISSDSKG